MNNFVDPGLLNENGWIDVDSFFQVKGAEGKLFAIGDCCTALPNTGSQILQNIGVIGYNVRAVLDAKKKNKEFATSNPENSFARMNFLLFFRCRQLT